MENDMNAFETYTKLEALSGPHVKSYRNDLLVHDKNMIKAYPGLPFIHFSRENGTHLYFLRTPDLFPAKGERVKYLFGTADREHILNTERDAIVYIMKETSAVYSSTVHYFDGNSIRKVSKEKALALYDANASKIRALWNHEDVRRWNYSPTLAQLS